MKIRLPIKALAAVGLRTALKYRKNWDKESEAVKRLQALMPKADGAKKGYRLYVPIGEVAKLHYTIPAAVKAAVKREGFVITNYLAKKCVKITDVDQKNEYNIGKVIAKDALAKAAFDNDPQLQNSKSNKLMLVVSCHPYDIIGMSTGRNWDKQSCMRLDDGHTNVGNKGAHSSAVTQDVAKGTMVAYAVESTDANIAKPKCRCLIKPFRNEKGDILYRRESSIYGNNVPGFSKALSKVLNDLNKETPDGEYRLVAGLYDDGVGREYSHTSKKHGDNITFKDVYSDPDRFIEFVRQEVQRSDDPNYNISNLLRFTRYDNDGEGGAQLHDTQIEEAAKLLSGNERIKASFVSALLTGELNTKLGLKIGTESGFFEELRNTPVADSLSSIKVLRSLGTIRGDGQVALLREIEKDLAKSYFFNGDEFIRSLLAGTAEAPSYKTLEKFPLFYRLLYTAASAARFVSKSDNDEFGEAFTVVGNIKSPPEKMSGTRTINNMNNIGDINLVIGYILDNAETITTNELYEVNINKLAYEMDDRRIFAALSRIKNPDFTSFFDHVKMEVFNYATDLSQTVRFNAYRHTFPEIVKMLKKEPDLLNKGWTCQQVCNMLRVDAALVMNMASKLVYSGEVLDTLIEMLSVGYKGEALEAKTEEAEFLLQLAIVVGDMLDPTIDVRQFCRGVKELSVKEAIDKYKGTLFSYAYHSMLSHMLFDYIKSSSNHKFDLLATQSGRQLLMLEAPKSFTYINRDRAVSQADTAMQLALEIPDMENTIDAIFRILSSLDLKEVEDIERFAQNYVEDIDIELDQNSEEFATLMQEGLKEAKDEGRAIQAGNRKRMAALEKIAAELGPTKMSVASWFEQNHKSANADSLTRSLPGFKALSEHLNDTLEENRQDIQHWEEMLK